MQREEAEKRTAAADATTAAVAAAAAADANVALVVDALLLTALFTALPLGHRR